MADETTIEVVLSSESTVGNPIPETVTVIGTVPIGPRGPAGAPGVITADDVVDLFTGTPDGSLFLRDDGTLAAPTGSAAAPDDAAYLVTTAHGDLSAEVVVGATPGGELGGTWAAPTVDASHSGSTHAAVQAAAEATAAADATAKVAAEATLARNADNLTSGTVADARIASTIARDSEVTSAINALSTVYQPLDSDLTAIAALTTTSYGRAFLELANAGAGRTALGLGTAATSATGDFDAAGSAAAAQAASQPLDSDLTAIAALTTTAFGRALLALADAAALRTAAGLVLGTDIYSKAAVDSGFQPLDADLTALAAANNSAVLAATTASFLTADETKLDGIEAGAEVNDSAAEILTKILTVDGAGSGLDADTLDGVDAGSFVRDTGDETIAGVKTFSSDPLIPDEAYDATAWNGSLEPPTKNAVRDKVEDILDGVTFSGDVIVPDEAYDATNWNGNLEVPTKNAIRDKIETMGGASPGLLVESGAESKVTALTELTAFTGDETFYVVEDDDGTPASRRITVENVAAGLAARSEFSGAYAPLASLPSLQGVIRSGSGSITTGSTTKTPIDSTNIGYQTLTLAVGDVVRCQLMCTASNSTGGWDVFFDVEVDQPTSGNVYIGAGNDRGIADLTAPAANYRVPVTALGLFVATEAGVHGFRPVWGVEGNTGKIWLEASGNGDTRLVFEVQRWPDALSPL